MRYENLFVSVSRRRAKVRAKGLQFLSNCLAKTPDKLISCDKRLVTLFGQGYTIFNFMYTINVKSHINASPVNLMKIWRNPQILLKHLVDASHSEFLFIMFLRGGRVIL